MDFLGRSYFFRCHQPLSAFKYILVRTERVASGCCQYACLLSLRCKILILKILSITEMPHILGPPGYVSFPDLPVLYGCFPLATCFTFGSVYMSMALSHFVTAYPSPSPYPQVHSLVGLCLYSRLTTRFFMTFFCLFFFPLDSIYMCQHTVFIFLFLTYFTLYDRL